MAEPRQVVTFTHSYSHTIADTQVKDGAGFLHTLTINTCTVAGDLTLYDNDAESGDVIAIIAIPVTPVPVTLTYDIEFATGLYLGFDAALTADITVSYR